MNMRSMTGVNAWGGFVATGGGAVRSVLYQALAKDAGPAYTVNAKGCVTLPKYSLTANFDAAGAVGLVSGGSGKDSQTPLCMTNFRHV